VTARLFACPACARRVRVNEERCPVCRVVLPDGSGDRPAPVPHAPGVSGAGLVSYGGLRVVAGVLAFALGWGALVTAGCVWGVGVEGGSPVDGPLSDGGVIIPGSCSAYTYVLLLSHGVDLPFEGPGAACQMSLGCQGTFDTCSGVMSAYYALCVDASFSICSCANPNVLPDYDSVGWQQVFPDGAPVGVLPDGAPVEDLDCGAPRPLDAAHDRIDAPRDSPHDSAAGDAHEGGGG
jgi:hypothetical protein